MVATCTVARWRRSNRPPELITRPRSSSRTRVVIVSGTDIRARRATASASRRPASAFQTRSSDAVEVGWRGGRQLPIDAQIVQEVVGTADQRRTVPDHLERGLCEGTRNGPRHGEDVPSQLEGMIDRDPRAAPGLALHDHQGSREGDHDPVPRREVPGTGRDAGRVLAHDRAASDDRAEEPPAARGIGDVDARAQDRDRAASGLERASMGGGIDPVRSAGDDREPRRYESAPEVLRDGTADIGALPRADDRDAVGKVSDRQPPEEQTHRRVREVEEPVVVLGIGRRDEPSPDIRHARGGRVGVDPVEPLPVAVAPEPA